MRTATKYRDCNFCDRGIYCGGKYRPVKRGLAMCCSCVKEHRERQSKELEESVKSGRRKDDDMIDGNGIAFAFLALIVLVLAVSVVIA